MHWWFKEKSPVLALKRTQPGLPMKSGRTGTAVVALITTMDEYIAHHDIKPKWFTCPSSG
jgi:hypothetical protein